MVFSSIPFLCAFLPVTLIAHMLLGRLSTRWQNALLIVASLLFYAYGEPVYVLLMLASAMANYVFGLLVAEGRHGRSAWLWVAVLANLGVLGIFKYAAFVVESLDASLGLALAVPQVALPLGISFYTFQAISYVVDVYRGDARPQANPASVLLYLSLFPQLVAGPIVKYHDIEAQMGRRRATPAGMEEGMRRFACGLAKKVLMANTLGSAADTLFAHWQELAAPGACVAAIAYMLQIYYDFSGYSDMAIGLGQLFGFTFQENFDHPYVSTSIKEFWRRWHISLSTWFKEYLYIPLGGNRRGRVRAGINKAIVFLCCGIWHGANWTFVVWGLVHGAFSLVEEVVPMRRVPRVLGHLYTMAVVTLSFVMFRSDSLAQALAIYRTMLTGWGDSARAGYIVLMSQLTPLFLTAAGVAILLAMPVASRAREGFERLFGPVITQVVLDLGSLSLVFACVVALSSGTYNPFIYFRF